MSSMPAGVLAKLDACVALFNRGSLDLPEDFLDRGCVFRMNGVAYHDRMGRSASDPLVRLVALGPAAYRFVAQAVHYAMPDVQLALDSLVGPAPSDLVSGAARLRGTLRGDGGRAFAGRVDFALALGAAGRVVEVGVLVPDEVLQAIAEARQR